jgi:hypothetical protein
LRSSSAGAAEEAKILGNKRPVKDLLEKLHKFAETGIANEKRTHFAEVELRLVSILLHGFSPLLKSSMTSPQNATGAAAASALDRELRLFRGNLHWIATDPAGLEQVYVQLWNEMTVEFDVAERKAVMDRYSPLIKRACADGVEKYDNFIPKALQMLRHRLRWDPSVKPEKISSSISGSIEKLSEFFGTYPDAYHGALLRHWNEYADLWVTLPEKLKALPAIDFWKSDKMHDLFSDDFVALGQWYANMPSSNVAAEGVYGVMRSIESDQRFSLKQEGLSEELKGKVNGWLLDPLLESAAASLKRVSVRSSTFPNDKERGTAGGGGGKDSHSSSSRGGGAAFAGANSSAADDESTYQDPYTELEELFGKEDDDADE